MEKDKDITRVVFRRWSNGDVIALFPDICESCINDPNIVSSYEHIGQHGAADYTHVIAITKPVILQEEYWTLFSELYYLGYNLKVCKRR